MIQPVSWIHILLFVAFCMLCVAFHVTVPIFNQNHGLGAAVWQRMFLSFFEDLLSYPQPQLSEIQTHAYIFSLQAKNRVSYIASKSPPCSFHHVRRRICTSLHTGTLTGFTVFPVFSFSCVLSCTLHPSTGIWEQELVRWWRNGLEVTCFSSPFSQLLLPVREVVREGETRESRDKESRHQSCPWQLPPKLMLGTSRATN